MNPFENVFTNLYRNSIFAPPKALQAVEAQAQAQIADDQRKEILRQTQATAQSRALQTMAETMKGGNSRQSTLNQILSNPDALTDFFVKGGGKSEDFIKYIEGGTQKPLEPITMSPGMEAYIPNAEGTGYNSVGRNPNAAEQNYDFMSKLFGPSVATELVRISGGGDPTEKQMAFAQLMAAHPDDKNLREIGYKQISGLLQPGTYTDPHTGRKYNTMIDMSTGQPLPGFAGGQTSSGATPAPPQGSPQASDENGLQPPEVSQGTAQPIPQPMPSQVPTPQVPAGDSMTQAPAIQLPSTPPANFQPERQRRIIVPMKFTGVFRGADQAVGLPEGTTARMAAVLSNFNQTATGANGERGIMQLPKKVAAKLGLDDPYNPSKAIPAAAMYVSQLRKRYSGNIAYALAAYNWQPENVDRWISKGADPRQIPEATRDFIVKVLGPEQAADQLFPDVASFIHEREAQDRLMAKGQQVQLEGMEGYEGSPFVEGTEDLRTSVPKAAFAVGPMPSLAAFMNSYMVALRVGTPTNQEVQSGRTALSYLQLSFKRYLEETGHDVSKEENKQMLAKLPQLGVMGFFETPSSALTNILEVRGIVENQMNIDAAIANQPNIHPEEVVKEAHKNYYKGLAFLNQLGTADELRKALVTAQELEKNQSGILPEIMERLSTVLEGGTPAAGEGKGNQELPNSEDLNLEAEEEEEGLEDITIENGKPNNEVPPKPSLFGPGVDGTDEELLQELRDLEKRGSLGPVPIEGTDMQVEPAGEEGVQINGQEPIPLEQRKKNIRNELNARRIAKRTGLPRQIVDFSIGVNDRFADIAGIPGDVLQGAMMRVGLARLVSPAWQKGRSSAELIKEDLKSAGFEWLNPPDTWAATAGEGAVEGAVLAAGLVGGASRLSALKGPGAVKEAIRKVSRYISTVPAEFIGAGATSQATVNVVSRALERKGTPQPYKGAIEIGAGLASGGVGSGVGKLVSYGAKLPAKAFKVFKPQLKPLRPPGPGAVDIQEFGKTVAAATAKTKARKGVLSTFTGMDPDKAITRIFRSNNPEVEMRKIYMATLKNPEAREGLKAGALDWLFRTSKLRDPSFTPARFEAVWSDPSVRRAMQVVLPKATISRIDKVIEAEKKLSYGKVFGASPPRLRPGRRLLIEGVGIGATGLPGASAVTSGASFAGRVLGASLMRKMGFNTIQATGAGAKAGQRFFLRAVSQMSSLTPPDVLLRQALVDPDFERILIGKAEALAAEEMKRHAKRAGRTLGGGIGVKESMEDQ